MKNVVVSVALLISVLLSSATAQNSSFRLNKNTTVGIPRLNLQYGNSGCHGKHIHVWLSRPDLGTTVTGWLFDQTHNNATLGWVIIGSAPLNLPIIVHTGQVCTLLVAPHMFLAVPLVAGSGPFTLFHVPNNPALRGIRVYAQGGMPVHYGAEEGFSRGTEMVIQ